MLDFLVILFVAVWVVWGYKRGFIKTVMGLISNFAALILAWVFHAPAVSFLKTTPIVDQITENIRGSLTSSPNTELPEIFENASEFSGELVGNSIETASTAISNIIITVIALVALFILFKILLSILTNILSKIVSVPVLKQANGILGSIVGLFQGIFITYIIFALLIVVSPVDKNSPLQKQIDSSILCNYIYHNNFIISGSF